MRSREDAATLKQIEQLRRLTVMQLREQYAEVFGENSRSYHKEFLFRRIAWRIQANAEGSISERARQRAVDIADDADLRVTPPRKLSSGDSTDRISVGQVNQTTDRRLPLPGTFLTKQFRGVTVVVKILDNGFEYDNRRYKSLSAIASEVTGTRWNGYAFFGLAARAEHHAKK